MRPRCSLRNPGFTHEPPVSDSPMFGCVVWFDSGYLLIRQSTVSFTFLEALFALGNLDFTCSLYPSVLRSTRKLNSSGDDLRRILCSTMDASRVGMIGIFDSFGDDRQSLGAFGTISHFFLREGGPRILRSILGRRIGGTLPPHGAGRAQWRPLWPLV